MSQRHRSEGRASSHGARPRAAPRGTASCAAGVPLPRPPNVVDLNESPSLDGYRSSALIREATVLRHPVEVFPWGTLTSRRADQDHTRPYVRPGAGPDAGPPGQTTPDNLGPLSRYHHRLKTHVGWTCHQPTRGVFHWRTPHGHWARVDHAGTLHVGTDTPRAVALHELRERLRGRHGPPQSVGEQVLCAVLTA